MQRLTHALDMFAWLQPLRVGLKMRDPTLKPFGQASASQF
jgi:hypothetical protein